jgi:hypothetical protein
MNPSQMSIDLKTYFAFISDRQADVPTLLQRYYQYHGLLNFGHRIRFVEEVKSRLVAGAHPGADGLKHLDVIGQEAELNDGFLQIWGGGLPCQYFRRCDKPDVHSLEILNGGKNEWQSEWLPQPFNMRTRQLQRPPFVLFRTEKRQLFVSTYGYQYFDSNEDVYWPQASSRAFGKSILDYPTMDISRPVVVVQDQFDASNFSHFLYDYLPRIIYFCEVSSEQLENVIFLIGGVLTEYHKLMLDAVSNRYKLHQSQFVFSPDRSVWNLESRFYFFSDQKMHITHPMNLCHPEAIRLLRGVCARLSIQPETPLAIYISRQDADMRRIANEADFAAILQRAGYCSIRMNNLDPISQISVLANARSIIAPHGMGLTNIFFNQRHARMLELFCPTIGSDTYHMVARSNGISYDFKVGRLVENTEDLSYTIEPAQIGEFISHDASQKL